MIFWIEMWLNHFAISMPAAFTYYSTRMILVALTSLIFMLCGGHFFIRYLKRAQVGSLVRTEACHQLSEKHQEKKKTPTMGGLYILLCMLASLFIWMDFSNVYTWILFFVAISFGIIGFLDDYLKWKKRDKHGLSARLKFCWQFFCALAVVIFTMMYASYSETTSYAYPLYIPFFKTPFLISGSIWLTMVALFLVCVIVGASNAVNLTDGLDGLAAGTLIITSFPFAVIAFVSNHIQIANYLHIPYMEGSGEVGIYLCAMMGACLGFLWYNAHPAEVIMGDVGSISMGAVVGASAVLLKREILLVFVGGIFVVEALSVILQVLSYRYRNQKRIFLCAPLHHHFEYLGWKETKVVVRFWIMGLFLALVGLATLKFQ